MKTYISFLDKKATLAKNKKDASEKLGTPSYRVAISVVDISMLIDYSII